MNQSLKEILIGMGVGAVVAGVIIVADVLTQKAQDKLYFIEFSKKLEGLFEMARIETIRGEGFEVRMKFAQRLLTLRVKMATEMRDRDGEYKAIVDQRIAEFKEEMGWKD